MKIIKVFSKELNVDKYDLEHLDFITQHRKILEHPIKDLDSDIDEKTYKKLKLTLNYIEETFYLK